MKTYDPVTSLETRIKDLEEKCRVLKFQNWELAEAKTNLINENYKLKEELDGMAMGNNIKIDIVKYINEGKTAAEISEITGVSARAIGDKKALEKATADKKAVEDKIKELETERNKAAEEFEAAKLAQTEKIAELEKKIRTEELAADKDFTKIGVYVEDIQAAFNKIMAILAASEGDKKFKIQTAVEKVISALSKKLGK